MCCRLSSGAASRGNLAETDFCALRGILRTTWRRRRPFGHGRAGSARCAQRQGRGCRRVGSAHPPAPYDPPTRRRAAGATLTTSRKRHGNQPRGLGLGGALVIRLRHDAGFLDPECVVVGQAAPRFEGNWLRRISAQNGGHLVPTRAFFATPLCLLVVALALKRCGCRMPTTTPLIPRPRSLYQRPVRPLPLSTTRRPRLQQQVQRELRSLLMMVGRMPFYLLPVSHQTILSSRKRSPILVVRLPFSSCKNRLWPCFVL